MARFTETDQAASLLQRILTLSLRGGLPPSAGGAEARLPATESDEAVIPPATARTQLAPSETVARELVATRAGYVQLTLHVPANEPERFDGETVGRFFRRAVRPLSSADQSAV